MRDSLMRDECNRSRNMNHDSECGLVEARAGVAMVLKAAL